MPQIPEELTDTSEKLARAKSRKDELLAQVEKLRTAWAEARENTSKALEQMNAAPKAVSDATQALSNAMRGGDAVEDLQQQVGAAQATAAASKTVFRDTQEWERARWEAMSGPSKALGQAQTEYANARLHDLIAQIAALVVPLRPLCDELRTLAPSLGIALGDSGFLLDESRPNIGPYEVCRDGSLRHIFFKNLTRRN